MLYTCSLLQLTFQLLLFQIITVGRFGSGTVRSRIPLGPFYGHSYILPWEWRDYADTHNYVFPSPASQSSQSSPVKQLEVVSQSSLLHHHSVFVSLLEDLHCRYRYEFSFLCWHLWILSILFLSAFNCIFIWSLLSIPLFSLSQPLSLSDLCSADRLILRLINYMICHFRDVLPLIKASFNTSSNL